MPTTGVPSVGCSRTPAFTSDECTDRSGRATDTMASPWLAAPIRLTRSRSAMSATIGHRCQFHIHERQLVRIGDGMEVDDDAVARHELHDARELAISEREHAGLTVDRLRDQRGAGTRPEPGENTAGHDRASS